jgi:CRP/FNR family transcriptional regulator
MIERAQIRTRVLELYPAFRALPAKRLDDILDEAIIRTAPAGTVMFDEHNPCQAFPMLIEGNLRVVKSAPNGREMQLYRVVPGEACVLTSSCLLGNSPYSARGIAETELTVVTLSQPLFSRLLAEHEPFRTYVFSLFAERISELMQLVEAVAFQRLDQRSLRCCSARAGRSTAPGTRRRAGQRARDRQPAEELPNRASLARARADRDRGRRSAAAGCPNGARSSRELLPHAGPAGADPSML